ncbi:MAG: HRDC domain-containing protein, partial [Bacteroides sp.]|nr:HRDC domain-containing protein [Bacteroides sp.]
ALQRYVRLIDEHLYKLFPKQLAACKEEVARFQEKVTKVAQKFSLQYTRLVDAAVDYATDKTLQERIHAASAYFQEQLQPLDAVLVNVVASDNKELKKKLRDALEELERLFDLKSGLLEYVLAHGFHVGDYLKQKALLSLDDSVSSKSKGKSVANGAGRESGQRSSRERKRASAAIEVPTDVLHPELYNRLVAWRNAEAARLGLPVYTVIQQKAMLGVSNLLPSDKAMLMRIPYFGKKGAEKYGDVILEMVRAYRKEKGLAEAELL